MRLSWIHASVLLQGMPDKRHANVSEASVAAVVAMRRPALKPLRAGTTDEVSGVRDQARIALTRIRG